ncbi:hypothetical protein SAMN04487894_102382 [Niabella drilacis]|uniref:Uncharacterized protein n=1 Tax=Niabella drilacis (strain DSM 25811 / CCM 8410 / CCUG 62505 / LMG 26954 / E90) TaxID=1285928 RepID=A0A1G6LKC8_NIADE|nr:hypothetical protein SAMN04487894_102382 [Niabella drilacis]
MQHYHFRQTAKGSKRKFTESDRTIPERRIPAANCKFTHIFWLHFIYLYHNRFALRNIENTKHREGLNHSVSETSCY